MNPTVILGIASLVIETHSRPLNLGINRNQRRKGGISMNGTNRDQGGIGWIIILVLLYTIFNPIPGPFDDAAVAAIGGYHALKRL